MRGMRQVEARNVGSQRIRKLKQTEDDGRDTHRRDRHHEPAGKRQQQQENVKAGMYGLGNHRKGPRGRFRLWRTLTERKQSRSTVSTRTLTPMLLCVWVSSKRVAALCTARTIKAPRPNAPMTSAAFSQCAIRSD